MCSGVEALNFAPEQQIESAVGFLEQGGANRIGIAVEVEVEGAGREVGIGFGYGRARCADADGDSAA